MLLGLPEFDMLFPDTVEETSALLSEHGENAELLAGGTDLLVKMKHRRAVPRFLINIKRVPGLNQIHDEAEKGVRIGALAQIQAISDSAVIAKKLAALSQAAGMLGTTQIRNLGTLGGNLANASPSAEFGPPLLVLEASIKCVGRSGERLIPLDGFFIGPGKSILRRDEILTDVHIPNPPVQAQAIYLKHSLRRMDVAMAGAAMLVSLDGDVCRDIRIALGAVAPTPFRARKAEAICRGQRLTGDGIESDLLEEVARVAADESLPIDDIRGHASYRKSVVSLLVKRGLEHVIAQARLGLGA